MFSHPVRFRVETPRRMDRFALAIRLVLLFAVGTIGCSSIYWVLYLAIPALVALRISQKGGALYRVEDGPRIVSALNWLAAAYAYLWLLTDAPPSVPSPTVELQVDLDATPTAGSAMSRIVLSLPALAVLAIASLGGGCLWLVGAVAILVYGRVPSTVTDLLTGMVRYQFRLAAYHLSLVDRYPTFDQAPAAQDASRSGTL